MLVFNRRKNESFMIGDNIKITIVNVTDGKVKIGIEAPKDYPVHRSEIYQLIQNNGSTTNLSPVSKNPANKRRV